MSNTTSKKRKREEVNPSSVQAFQKLKKDHLDDERREKIDCRILSVSESFNVNIPWDDFLSTHHLIDVITLLKDVSVNGRAFERFRGFYPELGQLNGNKPSENPLKSALEDDRKERFYIIAIPDNPRSGAKPSTGADEDEILDYVNGSSRICEFQCSSCKLFCSIFL
jgi:hypothetical protein